MTRKTDDGKALDALERRIRALLPEQYEESDEDVEAKAMGSAALRFDADGAVAWNQMWATFCDLAMAGGPPHKGRLLEPGSPLEAGLQSERYDAVVAEICRGVTMVTDLPAKPSSVLGWVRVTCPNRAMAGWLLRAIVMENVAARGDGATLDLPAAPHYRLEKEIKNVVTVVAKTCHYWDSHTSTARQRSIGALFDKLAEEAPLVVPWLAHDGVSDDRYQRLVERMADAVRDATGLEPSTHRYAGWLGLECSSVGTALWMMRAMVASNVLSRREGSVLFVPVNPLGDPGGTRAVETLRHVHRLAASRRVFERPGP